jgi:hypothetical protein
MNKSGCSGPSRIRSVESRFPATPRLLSFALSLRYPAAGIFNEAPHDGGAVYQEDDNRWPVTSGHGQGGLPAKHRRPEVGGHLEYSGFSPYVISEETSPDPWTQTVRRGWKKT